MKKLLLGLTLLLIAVGGRLSGQVVIFYEENFEGAWPVTGVAEPSMGAVDGTGWQIGDAATWSSEAFEIPDHTNFLVVNDDGWDTDNSYSYASPNPYILLPVEPNIKLSFDIYYTQGTYAGVTEVAELYLYDETTLTLLEFEFLDTDSEWLTYEYDLTALGGHLIYYSITYMDQNSWLYGIAVDNIKLSYEVPLPPVTVSYRVDMTNFIAEGNAIDPNGIRVGGNFADYGATSGGSPMVNWTPSDAASALTEIGSNVWGIDVVYPGEMAGSTQTYKFVNGDWGSNEGTDPDNTLVADGCGVDDGGGNINRVLVIPNSNATYTYCWDHCGQNCPDIIAIEDVLLSEGISIYPNPAENYISVKYNLAGDEDVIMEIRDISGRVVRTVNNAASANGANVYSMDIRELSIGMYSVYLITDQKRLTGSFVIQ